MHRQQFHHVTPSSFRYESFDQAKKRPAFLGRHAEFARRETLDVQLINDNLVPRMPEPRTCRWSASSPATHRATRVHRSRLASSRRHAKSPAERTPPRQRDRATPSARRTGAVPRSDLRLDRHAPRAWCVRHEAMPDPSRFVLKRIERECDQRFHEILPSSTATSAGRVPGVGRSSTRRPPTSPWYWLTFGGDAFIGTAPARGFARRECAVTSSMDKPLRRPQSARRSRPCSWRTRVQADWWCCRPVIRSSR